MNYILSHLVEVLIIIGALIAILCFTWAMCIMASKVEPKPHNRTQAETETIENLISCDHD